MSGLGCSASSTNLGPCSGSFHIKISVYEREGNNDKLFDQVEVAYAVFLFLDIATLWIAKIRSQ